MVLDQTFPLLPLHTVLFPGGVLPLKVFEPRYMDMLSKCLKDGSDFGICLIREGEEVGFAAKTYEIGTIAKISDWHKRDDGLLGITVRGDSRFKILDEEVRNNQLLVADVEHIITEPFISTPNRFEDLVMLLKGFIDQVDGIETPNLENYEDSRWVGFRLAEWLPIRLTQKQYFLQLDDPICRLERIERLLHNMGYLD